MSYDIRYQLGSDFEKEIERKIYNYSSSHVKIYRNFMFYSGILGYVTEIDLLVMTDTDCYCVESKNISGILQGKYTDKTWKAISKRHINTLQNPIKQNRQHINALKLELRKLGVFVNIHNIVCVGESTLYTKQEHFDILTPSRLVSLINRNNAKNTNKNFNTLELFMALNTIKI